VTAPDPGRQEAFERGVTFLRDVTQSGQTVEAYLASHPEKRDPTVADDVHVFAVEALKAGRLDDAQLAAAIGGTLNMLLGRLSNAFEDRELSLQVDYQRATTPEEYEKAREGFEELARRATEAGEQRRALFARAFMIQGSYFGSEAAQDPEESGRWIRRGLGDLLDTLAGSPAPMSQEDAALLMDFAFAPLDLASSKVWLEQRSVDALLRDVADAIEKHIPLDAPLSQDPQRDAQIAAVLARFSSRA